MSSKDSPPPLPDDALLKGAIPIDDADETVKPPEEEPIPLREVTEPVAPPRARLDLTVEPSPAPRHRGEPAAANATERITRRLNITGKGATRCKTFIAKLRPDAIDNLDRQVNAWLEAHPDYEVKLVTTAIGELMAKTKEPALFMTVFV
jgi:hypothetical protein